MKKESNIQNTIRLALSDAGVLSFRNNVGAYKTDAGHYVRYGVGESGGSDLICATPVLITFRNGRADIGVFTAIEVKNTNRKTNQKNSLVY